ncbi:MAG: hypothetical protein O2960_00200 [Verrucomicrobia bacterium]|nr:hypothetical protein [Verrucomicrobiota bacterium]
MEALQHPAGSILAPQELVCFIGVGEAQPGGIPKPFLAGQLLAQLHALRDAARQRRFRQRTGKVEIRIRAGG